MTGFVPQELEDDVLHVARFEPQAAAPARAGPKRPPRAEAKAKRVPSEMPSHAFLVGCDVTSRYIDSIYRVKRSWREGNYPHSLYGHTSPSCTAEKTVCASWPRRYIWSPRPTLAVT